jgi:hypothetical protein
LTAPAAAADAIPVTTEARLGFLLFFFLCWAVVSLLPWAALAVLNRGRGAEWALPVAVLAGWVAGVLIPIIGLRDFTGWMISLFAAFIGAAAGSLAALAVWRRVDLERIAREGDAAPRTTPAPTAEPTLDRPAPPSLD